MQDPKILMLDIGLVDPPDDPDRIEINPDEILDLAESILQVGLLQPVLVRPKGSRYEIVAGDRRFKAHQLKNISLIAAVCREMTDIEAAIIRATENLKRENLTPFEEAKTYFRLHEKHGLSWEDIGKRMSKSPGLVKRRCDILRMPDCLQKELHNKTIAVGVAEELWRISDSTTLTYYLSYAVENGVTVAVARGWAQDYERSVRFARNDVEGTGGVSSPYEPRPCYIPCDLCQDPVELGKDKMLRLCPGCFATIKANI